MGAEQLISEGGGMDADSLWSVRMFINVWIREGSSTEGTKGS